MCKPQILLFVSYWIKKITEIESFSNSSSSIFLINAMSCQFKCLILVRVYFKIYAFGLVPFNKKHLFLLNILPENNVYLYEYCFQISPIQYANYDIKLVKPLNLHHKGFGQILQPHISLPSETILGQDELIYIYPYK